MLFPAMLFGLLGLGLPVIIHLLQRQRLKFEPLATLRFIAPTEVANTYAPVPQDMIQLILRLLLLGLLILLMSRFVVSQPAIGPRSMVIILDHSMSMQQKASDGQTRFDKAKSEVLDLLNTVREPDRVSLMLVGDAIDQETGFLQDHSELRRVLRSFQVSEGGGRALAPAIRRALRQLEGHRDVNTAALVFSDRQRSNFARLLTEPNVEGREYAATRADDVPFSELLRSGSQELIFVGEPRGANTNTSIERAFFSPPQVYLGSSGKATATLRNHSPEEESVEVSFVEGKQRGENREVRVGPGESVQIDLAHRFESPVDRACKVEILEDTLAADNSFYLPMRMRESAQVLLISPAEEEEERHGGISGIDLLSYAINPGEALGLGTGTLINVRRVTPAFMQRVSLPLYSCVILYGTASLPERSFRDLAVYVENGGGLYIIPDEATSPVSFNERFGPLLAGAQLGARKEHQAVVFLSKDESPLRHSLLLPLVREEWGAVEEIHLSAHFQMLSQGKALCALRSDHDDWLGAVIRIGKGEVFLQLFSLDLAETSLPRSVVFVPMIQRVISTLGKKRHTERPDVIRVGDDYRMELPEFKNLAGPATVAGPGKHQFALVGKDGDSIQVQGLQRAGAYQVSHPAKRSGRYRWLGVNPVLGESDLIELNEEEHALLFGNRNVVRLDYSQLQDVFARKREVFPLMMALLSMAFVIEALAGAWQGRRKSAAHE